MLLEASSLGGNAGFLYIFTLISLPSKSFMPLVEEVRLEIKWELILLSAKLKLK